MTCLPSGHTRTVLALFLHVISLSFRLIRQDSPGRYNACLAFAIHAHLRSCAPVVHLPLDNKVALQAGPLYIVLCPQPHTHGRTIWPCHNLTVRVINWHVDVSLEECIGCVVTVLDFLFSLFRLEYKGVRGVWFHGLNFSPCHIGRLDTN